MRRINENDGTEKQETRQLAENVRKPAGSRQKTAPTGTRRRQTTDVTYGRANERTQGGRQQLAR